MSAPCIRSSPCQRVRRTLMEQASPRRDSDVGSTALLPPLGYWPSRAGLTTRSQATSRPGVLPVGRGLPAALPASPAPPAGGSYARSHPDSPVANRLHLHSGPAADHRGVECDNGHSHVGRPRVAMHAQRMPDGVFARSGPILRCRQRRDSEVRPGGIQVTSIEALTGNSATVVAGVSGRAWWWQTGP